MCLREPQHALEADLLSTLAKAVASIVGKKEERARLIAERDALWQKYIDDDQEAPDWTEPYFNPRLGPAARIQVNGQYTS